uniref:Uncharacterized protein n=1 Tax=Oryza sativa subsp. indica TaxID=39946 RepID=A0A679B9J3_ORYSI|nr:hypothetical protein [Oryza sativa Indica Group]BBD82435.1 hypothetical protein [Oryza sativa Indica Group]
METVADLSLEQQGIDRRESAVVGVEESGTRRMARRQLGRTGKCGGQAVTGHRLTV